MTKFADFLKRWWPTIAPILAGAALAASQSVQDALAANPKTAFVAALVGIVLAHWRPSPSQPKP